MASSNVSKLRFMTKAREPTADAPTVTGDAPESDEKWALSVLDTTKLKQDDSTARKLISINTIPRRSYGGANPYIEQQMQSIARSKKLKTK